MSSGASGQESNSAILTLLRRLGEACNTHLARQFNLTQTAAGERVRGFKAQKLARKTGKRVGSRGQPATLLRLDPHGTQSTMGSLLIDCTSPVI